MLPDLSDIGKITSLTLQILHCRIACGCRRPATLNSSIIFQASSTVCLWCLGNTVVQWRIMAPLVELSVVATPLSLRFPYTLKRCRCERKFPGTTVVKVSQMSHGGIAPDSGSPYVRGPLDMLTTQVSCCAVAWPGSHSAPLCSAPQRVSMSRSFSYYTTEEAVRL